MRQLTTTFLLFIVSSICFYNSFGQSQQPYTASFIARMGVDTVLVETYTMVNNHLYGKYFVRVPEDYIGEFSVHFYPNGSIREFNVNAMDAFNSSIPFQAQTGGFEYRLNMNCKDDTCTYYNSKKGQNSESIIKHASREMDFVGGWAPLISLMEWSCMRLVKSGKEKLPLKMINHSIGVYDIGVLLSKKDTVIFGGPFLEYTKIKINEEGRIINTNGMGTPWNYIVTKHDPIDIDQIAKRMAKTQGIGEPSPKKTIQATIQNSKIDIAYQSPFKRGRIIFGSVVPYDSIWRTGAGRPTTIRLENNIRIGKTLIPKGQYSIYTIPKRNEWELIFNIDITTWPTNPNRSKDFAQITIPIKKAVKINEQFTIDIIDTQKGGELRFSWDDIIAVAEFEVIKN